MNKTKIEWVKNPDGTQGYTHNPISGCKYHTPEGLCLGGGFPCYAYKLANGRLKSRYLANDYLTPGGLLERRYEDPFYPRFWEDRLNELAPPLGVQQTRAGNQDMRCQEWANSKGIFVCDMSDLFGIGIPEDWTRQVMTTIHLRPRHRFYLLTKQPQNLIKFSPFPDNCWVGVSVCNDKMLDVAVDKLEDIQAGHKFISFEPLLQRLTLSLDYALYYSGIDWVIIGAQTKPTIMPKIEWVEEIVRACDKAGVRIFLKDNLKPLLSRDYSKGIEGYAPQWAYKAHKLRQEVKG